MNASTSKVNKVGCGHFVALLVSSGALGYALENHPEHHTAIWAVWLVAATIWMLVLAVPMLIRYRKEQSSRTDDE